MNMFEVLNTEDETTVSSDKEPNLEDVRENDSTISSIEDKVTVTCANNEIGNWNSENKENEPRLSSRIGMLAGTEKLQALRSKEKELEASSSNIELISQYIKVPLQSNKTNIINKRSKSNEEIVQEDSKKISSEAEKHTECQITSILEEEHGFDVKGKKEQVQDNLQNIEIHKDLDGSSRIEQNKNTIKEKFQEERQKSNASSRKPSSSISQLDNKKNKRKTKGKKEKNEKVDIVSNISQTELNVTTRTDSKSIKTLINYYELSSEKSNVEGTADSKVEKTQVDDEKRDVSFSFKEPELFIKKVTITELSNQIEKLESYQRCKDSYPNISSNVIKALILASKKDVTFSLLNSLLFLVNLEKNKDIPLLLVSLEESDFFRSLKEMNDTTIIKTKTSELSPEKTVEVSEKQDLIIGVNIEEGGPPELDTKKEEKISAKDLRSQNDSKDKQAVLGTSDTVTTEITNDKEEKVGICWHILDEENKKKEQTTAQPFDKCNGFGVEKVLEGPDEGEITEVPIKKESLKDEKQLPEEISEYDPEERKEVFATGKTKVDTELTCSKQDNISFKGTKASEEESANREKDKSDDTEERKDMENEKGNSQEILGFKEVKEVTNKIIDKEEGNEDSEAERKEEKEPSLSGKKGEFLTQSLLEDIGKLGKGSVYANL
ncbi:Don1p NDAI_0H00790 [Naumovozyma dairenensis CBS 421]|uniref:Uncharacterized protein n=1 Tax=Naumovozyma dairenensis (strain ATCC 10597 / BCRC 20456 / CBS 421 / NBRC 0211 / NRRL Y-12639) TaxID=1071378 RepID=G0WEP2_NAUDC|nr:hypothetical protein NDAI_0H00790 [Naumovozyma dairenensis CBS 421]CCD26253.1 hypothetical protein NDAI_0H00790 [Naumovozyma dairenensis CBS 421]